MDYFLVYIVKSTLCLAIFYLFFKVLLSKDTFFHFNRFVLLGGMIICATLPLINYETKNYGIIQAPVRTVENFFAPEISESQPDILRSEYLSGSTIGELSESPGFSIQLQEMTTGLYIAGFLITLSLLFVSILKMVRIIRKGEKIRDGKNTIVLSRQKISPFSWGRYIVLNKNDYSQNPEEILTHEKAHIRHKHSFDLVFSEFFILFHWFNPVAWLLKKELQDIHEYQADMSVIKQGIDATQYQLLLVKKAVGARSYAIANSFNHSKIKNRITMMLKEKSTRWAQLKLLLFVPLAAVVLQAFARPEMVRNNESLLVTDNEGTTILVKNEGKMAIYFNPDSTPPPPPPLPKSKVKKATAPSPPPPLPKSKEVTKKSKEVSEAAKEQKQKQKTIALRKKEQQRQKKWDEQLVGRLEKSKIRQEKMAECQEQIKIRLEQLKAQGDQHMIPSEVRKIERQEQLKQREKDLIAREKSEKEKLKEQEKEISRIQKELEKQNKILSESEI